MGRIIAVLEPYNQQNDLLLSEQHLRGGRFPIQTPLMCLSRPLDLTLLQDTWWPLNAIYIDTVMIIWRFRLPPRQRSEFDLKNTR